MKKTCNGGHRTIKKRTSTDPKKHFEVINFILGNFVNFLEEIYQEIFLDVSSPLKTRFVIDSWCYLQEAYSCFLFQQRYISL